MFLSGDRNLGDFNTSPSASHYVGLKSVATNNFQVGWSTAIHEKVGNILFPDGSVHTFGNSQLQDALKNSRDLYNNRLLFSNPYSP
jgi:hypothetical protein